jgi:tRNA(fMet)-specific endonuclease VapC
MQFLLDANAWIGHLRQTKPTVTARLRQYAASDVALCSVVLGELLFGIERSATQHRAANLALVAALRRQYISLPFDDSAAEHYSRVRAHLAGRGTMIGANDLMIAAIALAQGLKVVTHNTVEFSRVPGLGLEDWQIP